MKKVSVIMGIFNCEKTIEESIQSILNQTYIMWELIMCDDGSTDNTYVIAKEYEKKYPDKIKVLKNEENLRLAATLNHCLAYATGAYIARMDSDDICLPTRFEEQVNFLNSYSEYSVVGSQVIVFDENGDKGVRKIIEKPSKEYLIKYVPFFHPTIMMRREVYEILGGYTVSKDITRCEDVDLWFRFFSKGFKGYNIQRPLLKYRESIKDYKKRKIKYSMDSVKICYKGYKLLGYPKIKYIFLLKPIVARMIPPVLMNYYHNKKDSNVSRGMEK